MGAGDYVKINHRDIEQQSAALAAMKNELEENFKRAQAQVVSLNESGAFQGLSGSSFTEEYGKWTASITTTLQLMEQFGAHLAKTSKAFAEVDAAFSLKG